MTSAEVPVVALWFVLSTLFGWGVTNFLSRLRGPFQIGTRLRSLFGVTPDLHGQVAYDDDGAVQLQAVTRWERVDGLLFEVGEMLTCFTCCSFWVGMLAALVLRSQVPALMPNIVAYAVIVIALSTSMIWLDGKVG